jgi:translation initiation factor 4A
MTSLADKIRNGDFNSSSNTDTNNGLLKVIVTANTDTNNGQLKAAAAASSSDTNEIEISDTKNEQQLVAESASFEDYGLSPQLLRGIYTSGFEKPTKIQQKAILPIKEGKDAIVQAQSGTGKTGAFSIGLLTQIDCRQKKIQAIILSHTRELALQTNDVISKFGSHFMEDGSIFCQAFTGGTPVQTDLRKIQSGTIVATCTPGRIIDIIKKGVFDPKQVKIIVIDEADEMLSQGFLEQVQEFFTYVSRDVQIVLVSATMPKEVLELSEKFLRNPVKILVENKKLTLDGLKQYYVETDETSNDSKKLQVLIELLGPIHNSQSVIFVNTKRSVDFLTLKLIEAGYSPEAIHSDMPNEDRLKIMERFYKGTSRILVATDLIARGIDVQQISIVINYDMTDNWQTYLHRIGRAGRFGRKGISINFVSKDDKELMNKIEEHYNTKILELPRNFMDGLV